jgi:protein-tyrosine phosphatase
VSGTVNQASWLSINGGLNLRDVGGLPCTNGGSTRHGVLLRSGSLRLLTADDAAALMAVLGVETVVDLRTAREVAADGPSVLARAGVATLHLPLVRDDQLALPEAQHDTDPAAALERAYRSYLGDRGHHLVAAARTVARSAGATLVHCAAGKDRTGVTVAMLLSAVGVERAAVVADYTATNDVIEHIVRSLAEMYGYEREIEGVDMAAHLARPAVLSAVLEDLDDEYGGAAGWLRRHGLAEGELAALRRRLVRGGPGTGAAS